MAINAQSLRVGTGTADGAPTAVTLVAAQLRAASAAQGFAIVTGAKPTGLTTPALLVSVELAGASAAMVAITVSVRVAPGARSRLQLILLPLATPPSLADTSVTPAGN